MKISKELKTILKNEFDFVILKMQESESPEKMMYFFSGLFGIVKRAFNLEFSDDLLLTYYILEKAHSDIMARMEGIKHGQTAVLFHESFPPALIDSVIKLKDNFYNEKGRYNALKDISVLAYTTSGNGYYILEKKNIDIFEKYDSSEEK